MNKLLSRINPLARYGPCWCLTVFRWGRLKAELCYTPGWYETPEHAHPNSDGEFWVIYGKNRYIYRKVHEARFEDSLVGSVVVNFGMVLASPASCHKLVEQGYNIDGRKYWKLFSVRAGTPHAFKRGSSPMIWLCFERWKSGVPVTSVAEDLVLV